MDNFKISIIIPVYNVESYIKRCLESIFTQNVDDSMYEVLIVNDGSTDNSMYIVNQYASKHDNIRIIQQLNLGAAAARNAGIKNAKGEYIWFVDGDDAIAIDSLKIILRYCREFQKADFLIFDCRQLDFERHTDNYWKTLNDRYLFFFHRYLYLKKLNRNVGGKIRSAVLWLLVYRKDYLVGHNLYLTEGIINEDNEFFMRLFFFANEIRYIPFAHYLYTLYRPGSVTTLNMDATIKIVDAACKTIEVWQDFSSKYVKNTDDLRFVSSYLVPIYARLLKMQNVNKKSEVYERYLLNKEEWIKGFKQSFWKCKFSLIGFLRYLSILYFPKYYDYISLSGIINFFKR